MPALWGVSFAVEDADATAAKAQELGGSLTMTAVDVEGVGRIAGLIDPYGAVFNVAALAVEQPGIAHPLRLAGA